MTSSAMMLPFGSVRNELVMWMLTVAAGSGVAGAELVIWMLTVAMGSGVAGSELVIWMLTVATGSGVARSGLVMWMLTVATGSGVAGSARRSREGGRRLRLRYLRGAREPGPAGPRRHVTLSGPATSEVRDPGSPPRHRGTGSNTACDGC